MPKRVALVTGAIGGIGRAIALRLARDGFDVAISDIDGPSFRERLDGLAAEINELGVKALPIIADVSMDADVQGMIAKVVNTYGSLDVMVANAGICITKPFLQTTVDDWDRVFQVNARGVFLCYKHAGEQMVKQGRGGRIIGASSVVGKQGAAFLSAYSATKFAVRGLTQAAAQELGKHGITVNAYAPGAIDTAMLQKLALDVETITGQPEYYNRMKEKNVVGHIGTPADVASVVAYLASSQAHFITGQTVSVNGGQFFD